MATAARISDDLKAAMKARDADATRTLRSVLAAVGTLRTAEGRGGAEPTDDEVGQLVVREAKKRREAAEAYRGADRPELADQEERELAILQRYLPEQLDEDALRDLVARVVAATGASAPSDLGKVMGALMPEVRGKADGKLVHALVREALGA